MSDKCDGAVGLDFMRGHVAATMALVHGLIDQGVVDPVRLEKFFDGFVRDLPDEGKTLALRLVMERWQQDLKTLREAQSNKSLSFEVINGGRDQGS